jgi:hypothetical protein
MCIKGTTTTHLRSRWGRVETEEGWWRCREKRQLNSVQLRDATTLIYDVLSKDTFLAATMCC